MEENKEFKKEKNNEFEEEFKKLFDTRKEGFDKFKLAALSAFETELDALLNGMENEDEVTVWFKLEVVDAVGKDSYERQTIRRHSDKEIALVNPKTVEDLKPIEEDNQNGTEV